MRKGFWLTGLALAVLVLAAPAQATSIDFSKGGAGTGGSITLFSDDSLLGIDIPIGNLDVNGAPLNNGSWDVTGGLLSFSTGGLAGTNFIQIVGAVPALSLTQQTLLLGTISEYLTSQVEYGLVLAKGPDAKSEALLAALGIPLGTPFQFFGFSTPTVAPLKVGVPETVNSTDINNLSVPEPGSMLLLGSGLIGLAGVIRRRLRK